MGLGSLAVSAARFGWLLASLACVAACASTAPPPAAPAPPMLLPTTVPGPHLLTRSDCVSLADWIKDVCQPRAPLRLAKVDGWCGDIEQRTTESNPSWIDDCMKHVTYLDNECFRSTTSIGNVMACDSTVSW
jgi:hypothetical protein